MVLLKIYLILSNIGVEIVKIWIISDTHFGHEKLADTKERSKDFSEKICLHWSKSVDTEDMVVHLRDVYWSHKALLATRLAELPGRKILVAGNHDRD